MPAYALPGTEVGPRRARILGASAILLAVLAAGTWRLAPESRPPEEIRVALLVGHIGAGIGSGTEVRFDGVRVGSISAVDFAGHSRQRIELTLDSSELFGLTDAVTVDYAPGNLFGVSALELRSRGGGTELSDGSTVDLTADDSVRDATLAALLKSTGVLTDSVLTPKLVELLSRASRDLRAFTPLLEALGTTMRSFVETQQMPPSQLFDEFGSALAGVPPMLTGAVDVLNAAFTSQYLRSPQNLARFSEMWTNVQYQLLPVATGLLGTAREHFAELTPILTLVFTRIASSVSTPELSQQQLTELLERLGAAFHDTPEGPVLDVSPELAVVPGIAAPLASILGQHAIPGGR
ncbi:MlaD family protein [Nocardia niwae]|uniref:MlaD family protein n=1 Tax=Nocardia niwae TaxID=626084 RepID=A0ABV2XGL3_9NOCA